MNGGFKLPSKFRQWIFAKPMVNDVLGPEQFQLREVPIPELKQGQALVRVKLGNIHSGTAARMANGMTKLVGTDRSNYPFAEALPPLDQPSPQPHLLPSQTHHHLH